LKDWWKRLRYVLALLGLCAIATCPIAKRSCTQESRAREADQLLGYLGDRAAEVLTATGKVPPLAAGPTPKPSCCDQGGQCQPDPTLWDTPAWHALAFSIDSPYRFTYEYIPDPSGTSAVVRATGDVACSGQISMFELKLVAKESGVERTWTRKDPSE
jgi:hypothetical protein